MGRVLLSFHTLVVFKNHRCLFHSTGHAAIVLSLVQIIGRRAHVVGLVVFMVPMQPFQTRPMPTTSTKAGGVGSGMFNPCVGIWNIHSRCRYYSSLPKQGWIWAAKLNFFASFGHC